MPEKPPNHVEHFGCGPAAPLPRCHDLSAMPTDEADPAIEFE
jgi:hypothetical protein